jgi:RHS repeat-associated protein
VIKDGQVMFFERDHLGSVRAVIDRSGNVVERNDYTPFGLKHENAAYPISAHNRFKFNGKEEQFVGNLQLLDYGARTYDPAIARWTTPDPLAGKYYPYSPYNYTLNNPVRYIDPDGMRVDDYSLDDEGYIKKLRDTKDPFDTLTAESTGASMQLNDQSILPELEATRNAKDYKGHYAITGSHEAGDAFLFAANNSNVEWGLEGYQGKDGREYVLRTSHSNETVMPRDNSREGLTMGNQFFDMHSHPAVNGTRGGSGFEMGHNRGHMGDIAYATRHYYQAIQLGVSLPTHYVYHKNSQTIYQYTPWNPSVFIKSIQNYQGLRFIAPKR